MNKVRRLIGYARVSTAMQNESGAGLEAQEKMIRDFCKTYDFYLLDIQREARSGGDDQRPILQKCIQDCKEQGANLIVAKIDRLSRRISFISSFKEIHGIDFYVANLGLEVNKTMLFVIGIFGEIERDMISKRVKDGIAQKKRDGTFKGAPGNKEIYKDGKGNKKYSEKASKHRHQIYKEIEFVERFYKGKKEEEGDNKEEEDEEDEGKEEEGRERLDLRKLTAELNNRGNRTVQGKEWTPANLRKLLVSHPEEVEQQKFKFRVR